ncbi:hypothetical protein S40288_07358 [Stachybotrys chartarum IBT 40288]|nr:hypothetical protein S40288_07358 [Stachybotrys chartarum IBT 40288]
MNSPRQSVQDIPAFPPPPGATANLDNPQDHMWTINMAGMSICMALTMVAFGLRVYARYVLSSSTFAEDYTCPVAWGLTVFYMFTCFMSRCHERISILFEANANVVARYGEGLHAWELSMHDYTELRRWLYASSIIWIPAVFLTKVTILLLTARVFAVYEKASRTIYYYIWFMLIAYLPVQGLKIAICTPIKRYWIETLPGSCLDQPKIFLTDTAMAIVTDFLIMVIPIPFIWRLRLPLKKKIKILVMLGAGGCAVAVASYREYRIYIFQHSKDIAGDFAKISLCGTIEATIGIVCACLPAINLLVEVWFKTPPNQRRAGVWDWKISWGSPMESNSRADDPLSDTKRMRVGNYELVLTRSMNTDVGTFEGHQSNTRLTFDFGRADELLNMQELLRQESADGRREGWLESNSDGTFVPSKSARPGLRRAEVTRDQLRQDARDILIPERIWDGWQNNAEGNTVYIQGPSTAHVGATSTRLQRPNVDGEE